MTVDAHATEVRTPGMQNVVGQEVIDELRELARPFQGARVVHGSATAFGGVADMLHTLVPLMRSAGLDAEWRIISGSDDFFATTKSMHDALQGMAFELTPAMQAAYLHANVDNAVYFEDGFDFVCKRQGGKAW